MSFFYEINLSFEKGGAPTFQALEAAGDLKAAIDDYNSRSMLADNPKRIMSYQIIGSTVLRLVLRSEQDLLNPTKALRIFSQFFVSTHPECLQGTRMFRMQAERLPNYSEEIAEAAETSGSSSDLLQEFRQASAEKQLEKIYTLLLEIKGRI